MDDSLARLERLQRSARTRPLGSEDWLTITEALELMRSRRAAGRRWLDERGLIHDTPGLACINAAELSAALRGETQTAAGTARAFAFASEEDLRP
jgi:hypothetical protein